MTPKEKAKDLVEKIGNVQLYIYLEPSNIEGKIKYFDNDLVKECALIAVDEIIEYHESLYNKGLKDVHIALSSPIKPYSDVLNPLLNYWQEVKQEIEKI